MKGVAIRSGGFPPPIRILAPDHVAAINLRVSIRLPTVLDRLRDARVEEPLIVAAFDPHGLATLDVHGCYDGQHHGRRVLHAKMRVAQLVRAILGSVRGSRQILFHCLRQIRPRHSELLAQEVGNISAAIRQIFRRMDAVRSLVLRHFLHKFSANADRSPLEQRLQGCNAGSTVLHAVAPGEVETDGSLLLKTDQGRA
jgi:hypothetical protein